MNTEAGGSYVDNAEKNGYDGEGSFKAIKSEESLIISGGTIDITSLNDGIHLKTLKDEEIDDDGNTYTITTLVNLIIAGGDITVFFLMAAFIPTIWSR